MTKGSVFRKSTKRQCISLSIRSLFPMFLLSLNVATKLLRFWESHKFSVQKHCESRFLNTLCSSLFFNKTCLSSSLFIQILINEDIFLLF
nr:MAG TPA: hypothetical protein [Caudoviricetes sp.]